MAIDWSRDEVEAIVADYLEMLKAEQAHVPYNKAEHRRGLGSLLNQRTKGSVEKKRHNISAALRKLGYPFIDGYKPLGHSQGIVIEIVKAQLALPRNRIIAKKPVRVGANTGRYRGSKDFLLVYAELITAAQYRGLTNYQIIAAIMGLPLQGSNMGREVGIMLGEIVEDELRAGRPMLSAVCVSVGGTPGPGFYALAAKLGRTFADTKVAKLQFWENERKEIYSTWETIRD